MFDIFYSGPKPNLFAHEQAADSIEHARELSRTRYFWWVNYLTDYSGHDFLWEPVPWEADQTHVWPSQHQQNGGTRLVPKQFTTTTNYNHPVLERKQSVPIIGIDHGEGIAVKCDITTRYISDYLGTLRRVLAKATSEYVWVINSVCDYNTFDFTWHPSEWQPDMLHVFASDDQKFGDTFYIHVPSFLKKTEKLALLEWFETIHFVPDISVPRRPVPMVLHDHDSQVDAVRDYEFTTPVALFSTMPIETDYIPTVNLWREPVKTITPLTAGASIVVVPREAKNHLTTQLYDYPYIDRTQRHMYTDTPLDIVFIDNGEPNAENNWMALQLSTSTSNNKIHRSSGVTGRVAAYQAAAKLSTTPWFFAVFAKLEVSSSFDWLWQPDRLQQPKHYIFHALNPVNRLVYGHQAMIAYNRELVLANPGRGLDFTLDDEHEVVPLLSGTAEYAHSKWSAWRTAFRECLKLKGQTDVESQYRLNRWLGPIPEAVINSEWSRWGAEDAIEYYDSVAGDFAELKKSYDWAWLASYALIKRNLTTHQ
jgi:hypothetical protein